MSDLLSLLAINLPSSCNGTDAIPTDAVDNSEKVLHPNNPKPELNDTLIVIDGSEGFNLDVTRKIAPKFAEVLYGVTDKNLIRWVNSWDEFEELVKSYALIDTLVIWGHGSYQEIAFGSDSRRLAKLAYMLNKPGMPEIYNISLENCMIGLDISGMIGASLSLELVQIAAWPIYVGFHYQETSDMTDEEIQLEMIAGKEHILWPQSAAKARQENLIVYSYLYPDYPAPDFIALKDMPTEQRASSAQYRSERGYFPRNQAMLVHISKDIDQVVDAVHNAQLLLNNLEILKTKVPGDGLDYSKRLFRLVIS